MTKTHKIIIWLFGMSYKGSFKVLLIRKRISKDRRWRAIIFFRVIGT